MLDQTRLIHQCKSLIMKNITLIALKRITYIISVWHRYCHLLLTQILDLTMPVFIVERLLTDVLRQRWHCPLAIGQNATNYTEFLLPPSKGSHPTDSSTGILVLSEIGFIFADYLSHTSTPSHRTSRAFRMLIAQILTYRTPKCNAPFQWESDFVAWSPSQADSHGFYRPKPTEADRSTKNTSEMSDVFCVSLTSNRQRSFSNKIN